MFTFLKSAFISALVIVISCSNTGERKLHFTGVIEGTSVKVPALTGGEIIELLVDEGEKIQQKQIIAKVDTIDLSFQRIHLEGGLEEIQLQKEIAQTNLHRAEKEYEYLQKKHRRFKNLLENQSVSEQIVDDLSNQLQNAESAYLTARKNLRTLATKKKQLEAQYYSTIKKIKDATITAPRDGIISDKYFEEGEAIPPLSPIVELIDIEEVWLKIYISERLLPHIKIGQNVKVKPDGIDQIISGKISWISSKAEFTPKTILTPETRTSLVYAVKILIKNPDGILKHGMPVEVQLEN